MSDLKETREYRSNSFSLLLRQKEYALEVYNVLNGTDYDNPDEIQILELEGTFSLTVHGDSEFIIGTDLNLYEQQSTINPNMPLRFLIYVAKAYQEYVRNKNIFGTSLVKIPNPKFVVFYNGVRELDERVVYKLSDAFEKSDSQPELELKCVCININPGYNEDIKSRSPAISGYMCYIEKVWEHSKSKDMKTAVEAAVDECIKEGILVDFFKEYKDMIISSDPIDGTVERREWFARQEGIEEGMEAGKRSIIEGALRNGSKPEEISRIIGIPLEEVLKVQKAMLVEV